MSKTTRKWVSAGFRLVVCTLALGWVLYNVSYYDYVALVDGSRLRAAHITEEGATVVSPDGTYRQVSNDEIALGDDGHRDIQIGLGTTWETADKSTLLLCLLIFAPATFLQSLRFRWLLRAQEIEVSYWESVKLCFAGNFLNFITALGSTGGDVFKMYYVSLHTDQKTEAVTTVFLDRIIGLLGLLMVVGIVLVARVGDSKLGVLSYGVGVILLGGVFAVAVLFSDRLRMLIGATSLLSVLPFAGQIRRAVAATRRLVQHKRLVAAALASTFALQLVAITSFVVAAVALGMRTDGGKIWDYYAYLASGVVVAAVPISFQGLGTMEAFYKHVFLGSHGTLAALLCLAMAVRAINLLWALPGLIVTMTGAYRPRIPEEDVQFA